MFQKDSVPECLPKRVLHPNENKTPKGPEASFRNVWVVKYVPCQRLTRQRLLSSHALSISQSVVTQRHSCLGLNLTKRFT